MVEYRINTQKGDINFSLPVSIIQDNEKLFDSIVPLEKAIIKLDKSKAIKVINSLIPGKDKTPFVVSKISDFIDNLLFLEKQQWDRIWVRIII
jgi:hypothetical protein